MNIKRKCLMLSDLQSGAEEVTYVLEPDYDHLTAALREVTAERDRLKEALTGICALRTYTISQSILIDSNPERLLKAADVFRIARAALAAAGEANDSVSR